ncbi:MAG: ATP-binding protein [Chthonomonadales bacterium]
MRFGDIIGHEPAIRVLRRALAYGEDTGTFLILGEAGVGKTALAEAFAAAAACLSPQREPFDACGECASCRRAVVGAQPEIVTIAPAGEQTQIWQFWDREGKPPGVLQRALGFAPTVGRKRVFIIERADTLTEAAANSLLKVLEEPPPYVLFVLLAAHASRLLPTILSRARMLRLSPVPVDELAARLQEVAHLSYDEARALAIASGGRPGVALSYARAEGGTGDMDRVLDWAEALPTAPALAAPQLADTFRRLTASATSSASEAVEASGDDGAGTDRVGRGKAAAAVDLATMLYRDLLAASLKRNAEALVFQHRSSRVLALAHAAPPVVWASCLEALLKARRRLDQNVSVRLVLEGLTAELVAACTPMAPDNRNRKPKGEEDEPVEAR